MSVTDRDIAVVLGVVTYYVLSRQQIQRLCFPGDKDGRITRKRIQGLVAGGYVHRHSLFVYNAAVASPAPVYYPARKGCELLAAHFDDEQYLAANTDCPQPHLLYHWLEISNTHLELDAALAAQQDVKLDAWFNEWEVVNKRESAPERRFRIYSLIRETPRLVCAPDAAFLLSKDGYRKAYFLEQDRNTTGVERLIAQKTPGYAAMAQGSLHLRIFPSANVPGFAVLLVASSVQRREALRRAMRNREGADLWKFAAAPELTAARFLHEPVFYPCEGEPAALVRRATHA